jgi:hypothetical protein
MILTKTLHDRDEVIPLIAALPFEVSVALEESEIPGIYDPLSQRTRYAGRGYSTCRYDDSAGGLFSTKSDTSRDD